MIHIQYWYTYIVGKYKIYFYELYKQVEKRPFLACFAASAHLFYIQQQCTYIVLILQNQKVQNHCQMVCK